MKVLLFFIFTLISIPSMSADLDKCQEHFVKEFNEALRSDNGLINAQLSLTALKLAQRINPNKENFAEYVNSIVSSSSIETLQETTKSDEQASALINKYKTPAKSLTNSMREERLNQLRDQKEINDLDIAILISELMKDQSSSKVVFNENDLAMTLLVANSHEISLGGDSFYISNFIAKLLIGNSRDNIARGFKKAKLELKKEINKLKAKVYLTYKEDCLDFFSQDNLGAQNISIFNTATCSVPESEMINSSLLNSIEKIVQKENLSLDNIDLSEAKKEIPFSSNMRRKIQDEINQTPSNKKIIVDYYKKGLSNSSCDGFAIVDKENNQTSVYSSDGEEVMSVKSIIGVGKRSKFLEFNPDSILRKWPVLDADGAIKTVGDKPLYAYSKTTGAGTYFVNKTLSKTERKLRKYDKEFNDRVLVLYSKTSDGDKEEIQAVHGVPNTGWINNREQRMTAFHEDDAPMNLSAGCVNLEGYSYDILNEFVGNNCPIYILPQDDSNHYIVKNGKLSFKTSKSSRLKNSEPATSIKSDGTTKPSTNNSNEYRFSPLIQVNSIKNIKFPNENNLVSKSIFDQEKEIFNRAKLMESEDFEDLLALTISIEKDPVKAKETLLNLYNAQYRAKIPLKTSLEEKRELILQKYREDFDQTVDIKEALDKSLRVNYEY